MVDDFLPTTAATLDERQTAVLMNQAPGLHGTNVLQSPKVTVFNGQKVFICNYEQTPFVVGLQNLESGARQPKIAVVDDGIKLNIRTIQIRRCGDWDPCRRTRRREQDRRGAHCLDRARRQAGHDPDTAC